MKSAFYVGPTLKALVHYQVGASIGEQIKLGDITYEVVKVTHDVHGKLTQYSMRRIF